MQADRLLRPLFDVLAQRVNITCRPLLQVRIVSVCFHNHRIILFGNLR